MQTNTIDCEHHKGASPPPSTLHPDRSLTQCWSRWLASHTHLSKHTYHPPKTPPTNTLHQSDVCLEAFIYSLHSLPQCIIYIMAIKVSGDDVNISEWEYQKCDYMEGKPACRPWMLILWRYWKQCGENIRVTPSPAAVVGILFIAKRKNVLNTSWPVFASLWTRLAQLSALCGFRCYGVQTAKPKVILLADSHPWPQSNGQSPAVITGLI